MTDLLFSQLLIIFLCIPPLVRPFAGTLSQYQSKRDTFSVIPVISLFICILSIIAFNLELSILVLLLFCLLVFFLNLNRFISYCTHMQRDYFNGFFKSVSALLLAVLFFIAGTLILFRPEPFKNSEASYKQTLYYGSVSRGFFERNDLLDPLTAVKTECLPVHYSPDKDGNLPCVLYIPDVFCTANDALEQMLELSRLGYRVVSFDFYPSDITYINTFIDIAHFRSFFQRMYYSNDPSSFNAKVPLLQANKERELESGLSILQSEEFTPVFIISEGYTAAGAEQIQKRYPQAVKKVFTASKENALSAADNSLMSSLNKTKPLEFFLISLRNGKKLTDSWSFSGIRSRIIGGGIIQSTAQRAHSAFQEKK